MQGLKTKIYRLNIKQDHATLSKDYHLMNYNHWLINIKFLCFFLLIIYVNQKNRIKSFINIISKKKKLLFKK